MSRLKNLSTALPNKPRATSIGKVLAVQSGFILTHLPSGGIGDICVISKSNGDLLYTQIVAFNERGTRLAAYDGVEGISPGNKITHLGEPLSISFNPNTNNTENRVQPIVLNCLGKPLQKSLSPQILKSNMHMKNSSQMREHFLDLFSPPPSPLQRAPISDQMLTGIHAIDLCCPIGYGQRVGLFAGPGVGKSTLLGMIAQRAEADRIVIALVGERGREVSDFITHNLSDKSKEKTVMIVATSDENTIRRRCAGYTATAVAEFYRNRGENVLLLFDSLTRSARAIRDLSLSTGELPVRQGYTSAVFEELPKLIERAGTSESGSITAIYTVLTSYNDNNDILSEEVKSLLDGHIVLDRSLAEAGQYPAIDITRSVSRLANEIIDSEAIEILRTLIAIRTRLKNDKGIMLLGGTPDAALKKCIALEEGINQIFSQSDKNDRSYNKAYQEAKEITHYFRS